MLRSKKLLGTDIMLSFILFPPCLAESYLRTPLRTVGQEAFMKYVRTYTPLGKIVNAQPMSTIVRK